MPEAAIVIPVAGGKGGVGKTLITANLALALANEGYTTIAVDLDLGNSNLHSLLGLPNQYPGIGDYLRIGQHPLEHFLVQTDQPQLQFLPGDGRMPFMANITFAQKNQLISRIKALPAQYILLDLGAGCAFHTLDFFCMAGKGIVVGTPEFPAVMSALVFLKNLVLREIERSLPKGGDLTDLLQELYVQPMKAPQLSVPIFMERVVTDHPEIAQQLAEVLAQRRPRLVFNMGEHPDDLKWLQSIDRTAREILSIEVDHFGFVFSDPAARSSIRQGKALLASHPDSLAARNILQLARRVIRFWERPIPNSWDLLSQRTWSDFEERSKEIEHP